MKKSLEHVTGPVLGTNIGRSIRNVAKLSVAVLALTAQAANAKIECPSPNRDGTPLNWNIEKILDHALWTGATGDVGRKPQMMLCLHRGHHSNEYDNIATKPNSSPKYPGLRNQPDNSAGAIYLGLERAPCIEVDVASATGFSSENPANGYSQTVLSHDSKITRVMAQADLRTPNGTTIPDRCSRVNMIGSDTVYRCGIKPPYTPSSDTYQGPQNGLNNFGFSRANDGGVVAIRGNLRTTTGQSISDTGQPAQTLADLFDMMARCVGKDERDNSYSKIGLVVLDAKDLGALNAIRSSLDAVRIGANQRDWRRHLMVKIKPWKMTTPDLAAIDRLLDTLTAIQDHGVPILDTIAQGGYHSPNGAVPISNVDYNRIEEYYRKRFANSVRIHKGQLRPTRAIELSMPGNNEWDPIRSGRQKIWMPNNCTGSMNSHPLSQQAWTTSVGPRISECNLKPRTGSNKSFFPQIWSWIPLPDGKASRLLNGNGTTATPPLPRSQSYRKENGKFVFGIPYGSGDPVPMIRGKNDQEFLSTQHTDLIRSGVVTVDSIEYFYSKFGQVRTVNQDYFKFGQ